MKKTLLTLIILFCTAAATFALPGFTPFVPDTAGEYVYYRDYSFARESYIGILNYDDTSYQIRYYAPTSRQLSMPEKDIALLFTINPESDFFDMTGEKIISELEYSEDELDIINYMHDILYEFSARRIKADPVKALPVYSTQEYEQFGGKVTICFDSLVPLFNIKNIKNPATGELLLSCITFGRIINGEDKSFENFKGLIPAEPYHAPTTKKVKGKSKKYTTKDGQSITLDSNWKQTMENCWMLGDEAFLTIASVPVYFEEKDINDIFVLRRIAESTGGSYMDYETMELTVDSKKNLTKILAKSSQPDTLSVVYIIKQLTTDPTKEVNSYLSLAAYEDSYLDKSSYYTNLLKTFKD